MRALVVAGLAVSATVAEGQGLRVRLVDARSGEPVPIALVGLVAGDVVMASGLTRPDGSRFFPADPNGSYRVRVIRPGLATVTSDAIAVPGDGAVVDVAVEATPLDWRALRAAPRSCRPARGTPQALLLEQAVGVLRIAELARGEGREAIAIRRFERALDRDDELRSEREVVDRRLGVSLFRTASSAQLAAQGFAFTDSVTGIPGFFGPDLAYLGSDEFAASHCYAIVDGPEGAPGWIGLAFTPTDASTPQPAGTVWFDRDSAFARVVDFTIQGGSARGGASGRITLERLPSGTWIARDWNMKTPVHTSAGQLLGYRDQAGEALQVSAAMLAVADSITNSRRPPGRITGFIFDSLARRPFAGAVVTAGSTGPSGTADSTGIFWIRSVPAGFHQLTIRHPVLDSIGTRVTGPTVRVGADSTSRVDLAGPSLRTLKGGACDDTLGVLTGRVRDVLTGAPMDSARVTLSWIELLFRPDKPLRVNPVEMVVGTDSTGRYAACVPARLEVTVSAEAGVVRTGRVDVRPEDRGIAVLDLAVDRSAGDTLVGSAVIQGVVQYQDRIPIANATVLLTEPQRTVTTDSLGRFRIASIPGGTRVIDTRALGHAAVRAVVDARVGDTATTEIFMRRVSQLDAVVVRASAGVSSRALQELEERRRRGQGYRLTPVELLPFRSQGLAAVARALPFTTVQWRQGQPKIFLNGQGGRACTPSIFVDGVRSDEELMSSYSASELLAVEFFNRDTDVPIRYKTSSECGAILLWTREGARSAANASSQSRRGERRPVVRRSP